MTTNDIKLLYAYKTERRLGWRAVDALRIAKTRIDWKRLDGFVVEDWEAEAQSDFEPWAGFGTVRLVITPDDDCDLSWLDQEEFRQVRQRELDRAARDGCCGIRGEYYNGTEWIEVDAVWGFIGGDWQHSGYDTDIMQATIDAFEEHMLLEAAAMEATRPDMYATEGQTA